MTNVRWQCPNCGAGLLAPSKPRKNDVRRYCLKCSEKTGRLVERLAPALERQRQERAEKLAEKRKAKEKRVRAAALAKVTIAGVNLEQELKRLVRLPAFGGPGGRLARRPPELRVTRRSARPTRYGFASPYENYIGLVNYPGFDEADIKETLLHELVHIYVGVERGSRSWHGEKFHIKMREAFREAYGVHPIGAQVNCYHGRYAAALRKREG